MFAIGDKVKIVKHVNTKLNDNIGEILGYGSTANIPIAYQVKFDSGEYYALSGYNLELIYE